MKFGKRRFTAAVIAAAFGRTVAADVVGFTGFAPINRSGTSNLSTAYSANGSTFQLTDGNTNIAASGFTADKQNISSFTTSFTYTCVGGDGQQFSQADGFAFVLQNDARGTTALGQPGSGLGVGGSTAITPSADVEFNLYRNQGVSRVLVNGSTTSGFNTPGVVLNNGHPFNVTLTYYGNYVSATILDTVNNQVFTSYPDASVTPLNFIVGGTSAYVGFTGGSGGNGAVQQITNFRYTSGLQYTPVAATGWNQDMVVEANTPLNNAISRVTATMDAGTAKTGYTFEEQGYNANQPGDGLPAAGVVFNSDQGPGHKFVTQPYTGNNAVMVDASTPSATINFSSPASYSALSFLCASGHGPNGFFVTFNFTDGAAPITLEVAAPDWYFNSPSGFATMGRVMPTSGVSVFDHQGIYPGLLTEDLLVPTNDPIGSLTITYAPGNASGHVAIFAVSGNRVATVPEPVGLTALALTGAATARRPRRRRVD